MRGRCDCAGLGHAAPQPEQPAFPAAAEQGGLAWVWLAAALRATRHWACQHAARWGRGWASAVRQPSEAKWTAPGCCACACCCACCCRPLAGCCREEGSCPQCGSINRLRQMADAALGEVRRMTGRHFASLEELTLSGLAIYNTECAGPLHTILQAAPGYVCRCVWPGVVCLLACMLA